MIEFDFSDLGRLPIRFLKTIANIVVKISQIENRKIAVAGGVFQNRRLIEEIEKISDDRVGFSQYIPLNDGGIALGQVIYYSESVKYSSIETKTKESKWD